MQTPPSFYLVSYLFYPSNSFNIFNIIIFLLASFFPLVLSDDFV